MWWKAGAEERRTIVLLISLKGKGWRAKRMESKLNQGRRAKLMLKSCTLPALDLCPAAAGVVAFLTMALLPLPSVYISLSMG